MTQPHPFDYGTPSWQHHPHRRRWLIVGLAIVAAIAVVVAVFVVRTLTADPANALEARFTQSIQWNDCGHSYYCGQIDVPVDWHDTGSGTAHLALMEHRPKGSPAGTILVNPGGPGGSGVDFVSSGVENAVDGTIASKYDVIGFDPPGVGYSSAVKCYDASRQDDYLYGILPGAIGTKEWIAADEKLQTQFGDACQAKTGALLANVDTTSAAATWI